MLRCTVKSYEKVGGKATSAFTVCHMFPFSLLAGRFNPLPRRMYSLPFELSAVFAAYIYVQYFTDKIFTRWSAHRACLFQWFCYQVRAPFKSLATLQLINQLRSPEHLSLILFLYPRAYMLGEKTVCLSTAWNPATSYVYIPTLI